MKKVLGMLCAGLLLVSSIGTGIQVQAENGAAKNEKAEIETGNLFAYKAFEGSQQVSVVKADSEISWARENVPENEIDETSRLIYDGPVSVRVELPEEKAVDGDMDGKDNTDDEEIKDSVDDKNNTDDKNDDDNESKDVEENKDDYKNFVVSIFHDGTEIWHAPVGKEETLDFICRISEWKWQEETQTYALQVFCFAEGDYQILVEEKVKQDGEDGEEIKSDETDADKGNGKNEEGDTIVEEEDRKIEKTSKRQKINTIMDSEYMEDDKSDSEEVKLIGISATVTVDRTSPEANLSWRRKDVTSGNAQPEGMQLVELSIRDANFRPAEVDWKVLIKKSGLEHNEQENPWTDVATSSLKKWSDWSQDRTDRDLWHTTVSLYEDGQYQMELEYTDLAGHNLQKACMGTLVIDTVSPLLTVDYPKPVQKQNGNLYYVEKVNLAFNVAEVNFRPEDFAFSVTRNGVAEDVQTEWKQIGTTQYQTILSLEKDGEYEIQAFYTDPYGNEMESYQSEKIIIDQTAPEIKLFGIQADTARKTSISNAMIQILDAGGNLNPETIQLLLKRVVQGADGTYLTEEVLLPLPVKEKETGSWNYRIPELTEDGIYTLTCQAEDYAGNSRNEIKTEDGIAHQQVKFSVNRRGSTFEVDDAVIELAERYYIYGVESDVEIREVNTDLIEDYAVRLNGTLLQEGKDFTTDAVIGEDTWSMRRYVVKKEVFVKEGEYHLVVESRDKTGTKAYSDVKKMQLSWVVDQSAPSVLLSGLEADHVYETEEQQVTAVPSDEGGKLKTFQVSVMDALGENRQILVNLSGETLEQYLKKHNGQVSFTIPEGIEQQVEILCADHAWKKDGSTNEYREVIKGVSVAKNQRSLRRMKRDLEKRLKEEAELSEVDVDAKTQKRMPVRDTGVIVAVVGTVGCAAVISGRRKKKSKEALI